MTARTLLCFGLLLSGAAHGFAGVYNPLFADPLQQNRTTRAWSLPADFRAFRDALILLKRIPNAAIPTEERRLWSLLAELVPASPAPPPTPEQLLTRSACLLRLRRASEAVDLLEPVVRQERDNFLLQSQLATAYFLTGQLPRAQDTLSDALGMWPKKWLELREPQKQLLLKLGWEEQRAERYRVCEEYLRKLIRGRAREFDKQGPVTLDAVFLDGDRQPLVFVGESGKYEAGKVAVKVRQQLPEHALDIVQQLLLWLPEDLRLYWLLGEVYNAQGEWGTALVIFQEIIDNGVRFPELMEHRQILLASRVPEQAVEPPSPPPARKQTQTPPTERADDGLPTWRTFSVGFGAGMVVGLLLLWQLRVLRR